MDHTVVPGYSYAVTASEDCTLTAANGWKLELKAGIQQHFTAQFDTFTAPVPITLNVNFNSAPAAGGAGGVSEDDLVTLGVLQEVQVVDERATSHVRAPSDAPVLVMAKGFACFVQSKPSTLSNGVAIVVGDGVEDAALLGCQMELGCVSRTLISEPLVSVQDSAAGRRCLFYFSEVIPREDTYTVRILQNGGNVLMPFSCSMSKGMYRNVSWEDAVSGSSGCYPALAWLVLKMETVYRPSVDEDPTEGSALPVSSGGVFAALSQLGGGGGKFVTVQVRGVKKVEESMYGNTFTRYLTTATGWRVIDPAGPLQDWQVDCGVNCAPGWLFRELWERPSATGETDVALVGWEFVLLAGEEEILLRNVRDMASLLSDATGGVNTLHYKLIYHD